MTRTEWLKNELAFLKAGQPMEIRCVMATPGRLSNGLCCGKVPEDRMRRGTHTCSPECQSDYRRLRREELRKGQCLSCGHNLSKKERERRLHDAQAKVVAAWDEAIEKSPRRLAVKAEAEVARLKGEGWKQPDFANALGQLLESGPDDGPECPNAEVANGR